MIFPNLNNKKNIYITDNFGFDQVQTKDNLFVLQRFDQRFIPFWAAHLASGWESANTRNLSR